MLALTDASLFPYVLQFRSPARGRYAKASHYCKFAHESCSDLFGESLSIRIMLAG